MDRRIAYIPVKNQLIILLLFFLIVLTGPGYKTQAQGWTFTFQLSQSGPCTPGIPLPVIPTLPNFGFPTQSQCEALRQMVLAIKASTPVYDDKGKYIGDCSLFYTCTTCTGSDIVTASQVNPGEVSFDGQFQGKPLFTTHESSAFEDWSKDYRQQLESYGITSILGNTLSLQKIPGTGDKEFDDFYTAQTASFNPTTPAYSPPGLDASVVDLRGKQGIVPIIPMPGEQSKLEKEYDEQLHDQGYLNLTTMDADNPAVYDETPTENQGSTNNNAAMADAIMDGIGDLLGTVVTTLVPQAVLPNFISSFGMNLANATPANIQNALNAISGSGSPNDVKDPGQLVFSSWVNTCTLCKWALTPAKY